VIGGAGHVGLPLAIILAKKGCRSLIYDVNAEALAQIGRGTVPFMEEGAESLLREVLDAGMLELTTDISRVAGAPYLVITIGTPVDEFLNPVYSVISDCVDQLLPHLSDEQTIILRSTVSPGATDWLDRCLREKGKRPGVAFCPERVVQGRAIEEIQTLPQIVSGTTPAAEEKAAALFGRLAPSITRMAPTEAEFAKLFCNASRYIQFAVSNQFYMMVSAAGLDYDRVVRGMKRNYARMSGFPGAGFAAGPCLFKDTMQLCAFYDNQFSLGFDAMNVNEGLPMFMVKQLEAEHDLRRMTVGLLGMAFKADSDDTRSSLSYKLKKVLRTRAMAVLCTDPHVTGDASLAPVEEVVERSDVLILCVPHAAYRGLDLKGKPVMDTWGFFAR